ncbi:MAG: lipocalin family protein [Bacteroidia bacterium]|nr:lipocalin family protein [Bacteroidia bacterium]NND26382.1 lipocalin family protein [Flavobacteriaceae bacterium]MBT8278180.1 lipocalin family protein [Bacteroidia bacterium]NNK58976.1 lipocalin family protein [Flavobacteriaceae bacterium]NNL32101.1 lipocalin family protein [Flavobacteriaceae bacterium]
MKKIGVLFSILMCFNCAQDPEVMMDHIEGYWEISTVKQSGKVIKSYTVNLSVDYFKVNADSTGYRKKVMPNLDGSFTITDHEIPFTLKAEGKDLILYYTLDENPFSETIIEASNSVLILKNEDDFMYTYTPYKGIALD